MNSHLTTKPRPTNIAATISRMMSSVMGFDPSGSGGVVLPAFPVRGGS
jgi:hypothetical protein